MRELKDSGNLWIGKIPVWWTTTKGKYIYCIETGKLDVNYENSDGEYPFFTCSIYPKRIDTFAFDCEALLVAGNGMVGFTQYYNGKFNAYQRTYVLSNFKDINPHYLKYYIMENLPKEASYRSTGSVIQFIKYDDLANLVIPYPTAKEQNRIANFLDSQCAEIDTLVAEIQSEIDTLEEYKKSTIYDAITHGIQSINLVHSESDVWKEIPETWKLVDIKYLFEIVKRIAGKEGFDILAVTQKGLKIKDITSGDGQLADNYSNYQFVYPTDYVMNHMDLLTGWVDCSTMFGVTSPDYRVFRLRDKEKHDLDYYKYVMQCCYMNRIFYSLGQGVSNLGRWRLQTSVFNNFKVPVPPIEEQKAIATYLNSKIGEINSIIDTKKEQLTTLVDYKKSLIYEYVTGKKEVPAEDTTTVFALEPRMMLLGTIIDKLGKNQKGRIQLQKILYLADMHLGLNRNVQYYRYDHGPYDIHLNDYIDNMVKNGWYQHRNQGGALLVAGKNHADFLRNAKNMFGNKETEIGNLLNLLQSMNVLKRTRMERIATLYAAWNDFLLEGITPTDDQIIQEVMTNWTENKGNTKYETWQDSLNKMKTNGLIPKGTGLHTLPKPQKEVADNE